MPSETKAQTDVHGNSGHGRLPLLDGIRGVAAVGVALSHFFVQQGQTLWGEAVAALSVEIFFPLSGFVLAPQILKVAETPSHLGVFYFRRWMRTLWPYWTALAISALLVSPPFPWRQAILYFFCVQDWFPNWSSGGFYPVAWSLAVEEWYYLLFPLWVMAGRRLGQSPLACCLAFIGCFQAAKLFALAGDPGQFLRTGTWFRLDAIALGFLGYLFRHHLKRGLQIWLPAAAAATGLVFSMESVGGQTPDSFDRWLFINSSGIFFTLCVVAASHAPQPLSGGPLAWLCLWMGKLSYPVYLLHLFFIPFSLRLAGENMAAGLTFYLAVLIIASLAFHQLIEKPVLARRPDYRPTG